jgi:hypothetical protein
MTLPMKFLLLVSLAVGGYFLWTHFSKVEEPRPVAEQPAATPAPVDFAIKMRVKRILDEWKKQTLAAEVNKQRPSMLDIGVEINEIRRRLYNEGLHDARSLKSTMVRAAVDLGYSREQAELLIGQVLGGR